MAHTTSIYYRDRLGFEPDYESPHRQYGRGDGTRTTSSTNMLEERHHGSSSVQRHSSSSSYAVQQTSSSSASQVTQQRHVSSSSASAASVVHHKSANGSSYAYEANGSNGHHANGGSDGVMVRMGEQRSLTGGHYEENLQQFKGSSKKREEVKVSPSDTGTGRS